MGLCLFVALLGSFLLLCFGWVFFKYLVLEFFFKQLYQNHLSVSVLCHVVFIDVCQRSLGCRAVLLVDSASKLGIQFECLLKETNERKILM